MSGQGKPVSSDCCISRVNASCSKDLNPRLLIKRSLSLFNSLPFRPGSNLNRFPEKHSITWPSVYGLGNVKVNADILVPRKNSFTVRFNTLYNASQLFSPVGTSVISVYLRNSSYRFFLVQIAFCMLKNLNFSDRFRT